MKALLLALFFCSPAFADPSILQPRHVISAASMTGTTAVTSPVIDARYLVTTAWGVSFSGTPNGTFSIQVSHNYDPANPTDPSIFWIDVGAGIPDAVGAAGTREISVSRLPGYQRFVYTNASSTGTLNVWVEGISE